MVGCNTNMNAFTIKDLENLSGIKAHTIRIWEQRYSFLKPQRSKTNIRYYCNDELKTVLNIALLNKYGYKISHIDRMTGEELRHKIVSLAHAQAAQERLINELLLHMIDLNMEKFEEVFDQFLREKGIDKTINYLVFPFLEKIGILWMTNHIQVAQEHLVSNIIRQKMLVGIENASSPFSVNKTVLLYLPEGEHHELGLLYLSYHLKVSGVKMLYLGANVPLKDLDYVVQLKKPDYVFTHLTCIPGRFNLEKYLNQIHERMPGAAFVVSGQLVQTYSRKPPANVQFKKSVGELKDFVSSLK
ncbi:MAG TPA: MerR family transcriptional regulator [Flavitalea sp.]|nr:MerR family transcriptional regulator [Flavitalea sp.]